MLILTFQRNFHCRKHCFRQKLLFKPDKNFNPFYRNSIQKKPENERLLKGDSPIKNVSRRHPRDHICDLKLMGVVVYRIKSKVHYFFCFFLLSAEINPIPFLYKRGNNSGLKNCQSIITESWIFSVLLPSDPVRIFLKKCFSFFVVSRALFKPMSGCPNSSKSKHSGPRFPQTKPWEWILAITSHISTTVLKKDFIASLNCHCLDFGPNSQILEFRILIDNFLMVIWALDVFHNLKTLFSDFL